MHKVPPHSETLNIVEIKRNFGINQIPYIINNGIVPMGYNPLDYLSSGYEDFMVPTQNTVQQFSTFSITTKRLTSAYKYYHI